MTMSYLGPTSGAVSGVPQPASRALMIGAFALAGGAMRRKGAVRIRWEAARATCGPKLRPE